MTKVTAQMSVSLDGYYAGPRSTTDPHDMAAFLDGPEGPGFFRVTRWVIDAMGWRERQGFAGGERSVNSRIIEETYAAAGAYVMGRRMFDAGEIPWGDKPPFRAPVFVVTHRDREVLERQGGTSFTFVTGGIERAVAMAREAAAARTSPWPAGARCCARSWRPGCSTSSSCTSCRCCSATACGCSTPASVPPLDTHEGLELTPVRVVETPEVTHIRYAVGGRAKLELDDRGSGGA